MTKIEYDAQLAAVEAARELIGEVAFSAAVVALESAYFEAVKVAQSAKWNKTRLAAARVILKGHILADLPGLRVMFSDFPENGEDTGPTMTVSVTTTDSAGKSKTQYLYGAPLRKTRKSNGKSYRGEVITLTDILNGDGTVRVAKGVKFDGTKDLAEACGHDKGKYGFFNELRAHGQKPGRDWEYTQRIADQLAASAEVKGTESA